MSGGDEQHEARRDLEERLGRVFAAIPVALVSAYLYGSHAEGRSHRDSDVDVAVLLPRDTAATARDRFELRVELTSTLIRELRRRHVDVVILNDAPPQLARRIVTRGRRVHCLDPEADRAFVRDIQLRAADLEPFLRRMRRLKLDAVVR